MIPTVEVNARSFRVFRGYKLHDLDETRFLMDLGQTFMPGTPLMLRELGLAAYLPAVLPKVEEAPDLPDEVAMIAYPSREQYARARRESVFGRMYTYTHLAIFDMAKSQSEWPEPLAEPEGEVTAFFGFGNRQDWQADVDVVFWAGRCADGVGEEAFAALFLDDLRALLPALADAGVAECVGQTSSRWAVLWLLFDRRLGEEVPAELTKLLADELASSAGLLTRLAERQIWREELPRVEVERGRSYNFIFPRDTRHFLR